MIKKLSSVEHTMQKKYTVGQLKSLEVRMSYSSLIYFILNSLPMEYDHLGSLITHIKKNDTLMKLISKRKDWWSIRHKMRKLEMLIMQGL